MAWFKSCVLAMNWLSEFSFPKVSCDKMVGCDCETLLGLISSKALFLKIREDLFLSWMLFFYFCFGERFFPKLKIIALVLDLGIFCDCSAKFIVEN